MGKPRPSLKLNNMAPLVKQVLLRFSNGDISKAELTRFAAEIGLRSRNGKKLTETSIKNLLESPAHAGYVYGALTDFELVLGKHPAVIPTETFEVNQSLLRNAKFKRDGEIHAKGNPEYLLRGLLLCSNCNKPMYGSAPRTGNGGRSPRYHCARQTCKGKARSVKSSFVHEDFDKLLKRIKPNDAILNLYKEILVRQANASLDNLNLKIKNNRDALNDISTQRSNAIKKFVDGALTQEEKDDYIADLEERKLSLTEEVRELEKQQSIRESDIEFAVTFMRNVDKQWANSDFQLRQRFQSMIFPRGVVYDSEARQFGTSTISPLYRCNGIEKASREALKSNLVAGPGLEPGTSWL